MIRVKFRVRFGFRVRDRVTVNTVRVRFKGRVLG